MKITYMGAHTGSVYTMTYPIRRPPGPAGNGRRSTVTIAEGRMFQLALGCLETATSDDFALVSIEFSDTGEKLAFLRHLSAKPKSVRLGVLGMLALHGSVAGLADAPIELRNGGCPTCSSETRDGMNAGRAALNRGEGPEWCDDDWHDADDWAERDTAPYSGDGR